MEDQIAHFNDNGFLIVDLDLNQDLLDTIVSKVDGFYDPAFKSEPGRPTRLIDGWKLVDEVRQLAVNPTALAVLEQSFGRKAKPFQTLNFPIGTGQPPHADTIHFNSNPAGFMAGLWVALEDIDLDNGPLEYYPGSHKLPELTMQDFSLRAHVEDYPKYEAALTEVVQQKDFAPEYGLVSKGQAIIWHPNLIHGGATPKDLSRTRHSQVTHYFFENCQYYTPMESQPGKLAMRNPIWVPSQFDSKVANKALKRFNVERRKLEGNETQIDRVLGKLRQIRQRFFSAS